jgi:hypothetical protein
MLTPELRERYERAAVALETHEILPLPDQEVLSPWAVLAWAAWDICNEREDGTTVKTTDTNAARLLRECLAEDRELT